MAREVRNHNTVLLPTAFYLHLYSWVESDSLRRQMKSADLAKLAACFYPDAHEDECLTTAYYHLWVSAAVSSHLPFSTQADLLVLGFCVG